MLHLTSIDTLTLTDILPSMDILKYEPHVLLLLIVLLSLGYFFYCIRTKKSGFIRCEEKIFMDKDAVVHGLSFLGVTILVIGFDIFYPSIENFHFYDVDYRFVFSVAGGAFTAYYAFLLIKYKYNKRGIFLQLCKAGITVSVLEFVSLRYRIITTNWYLLVLIILSFFVIFAHYLLYSLRTIMPVEAEVEYKELPVEREDELIDSRYNQADFLISEFSKIAKDEPYAILLDGKWGQGKTSLIKVLKKIDDNYKYVYISLGYSVNTKAILDGIEKQIRDIFEEEQFYSKSDKYIHAYFKAMCKLSSITVDNKIGQIVDVFDSDDDSISDKKRDFNRLLEDFGSQTKKRIVIVIDDLERCHTSNVKYIFSLLIETCNLNNCLTLLVCDYQKLLESNVVTEDYVDKYINRKYILSLVTPEDIFYQIIEPSLHKVESSDDALQTVWGNSWKETFDYMLKVQKHIHKIACDNETAEAYGIYNESFLLFKKYALSVEERLVNMYSNPRSCKKIWMLGIISAYRYLLSSDLRGGLYKEIDLSRVSAFYGLITYAFSSIFYEIMDANGVEQYKVRYRERTEFIDVVDDGIKHQYYDYVLVSQLLTMLNNIELRALNWLLLFENKIELNEYKTDKEKFLEEWADKERRNPGHYESYIEYVLSDMVSLKELANYLYENKSARNPKNYQLCINSFINIYDVSNDPDGNFAYDYSKIMKKCFNIIKNDNSISGMANITNAYKSFYDFLEQKLFQKAANIVWTMTIHSMVNINSAMHIKSAYDTDSYIAFLDEVIQEARIDEYHKKDYEKMKKNFGDGDSYRIKDITFKVVDDCTSVNKNRYKINSGEENAYYWRILESLIDNIVDLFFNNKEDCTLNTTSSEKKANRCFEEFCEPTDRSIDTYVDLLEVIILNWDDISTNTILEQYDLALESAKRICIKTISLACTLNYSHLAVLENAIKLTEQLYNKCNEVVNNKSLFEKYYEIKYFIVAARNEIFAEKDKEDAGIVSDEPNSNDTNVQSS